MRKINFVQGYYEWNVYVDNKCVFTFNDGSGELAELRIQMIDKWERHYIGRHLYI